MLLCNSATSHTLLLAFFDCFFAAVCLRMQVDPNNKGDVAFGAERAFADYVLANILLFLISINYLG
jgi:hypothetical protein